MSLIKQYLNREGMRVMAVAVEVSQPIPRVELVCNPLPANIIKTKIIDKKYKRVDRDSRLQFLDYVAQGRSISQVLLVGDRLRRSWESTTRRRNRLHKTTGSGR